LVVPSITEGPILLNLGPFGKLKAKFSFLKVLTERHWLKPPEYTEL